MPSARKTQTDCATLPVAGAEAAGTLRRTGPAACVDNASHWDHPRTRRDEYGAFGKAVLDHYTSEFCHPCWADKECGGRGRGWT